MYKKNISFSEENIDNYELIFSILNNSRKVKCLYKNYINDDDFPLKNTGHYLSIDDMNESIFNNHYMDCTSVLSTLIKIEYLKNLDFNNKHLTNIIKDTILKKNDPEFHLLFPKKINSDNSGRLIYIEYVLFHKLFIDNNIKHISTNNMGWWTLCLGESKKYINDYKDLFIEEIEPNQKCYLSFWGSNTKTNTTMIICSLETLKHKLINDAQKDLEVF